MESARARPWPPQPQCDGVRRGRPLSRCATSRCPLPSRPLASSSTPAVSRESRTWPKAWAISESSSPSHDAVKLHACTARLLPPRAAPPPPPDSAGYSFFFIFISVLLGWAYSGYVQRFSLSSCCMTAHDCPCPPCPSRAWMPSAIRLPEASQCTHGQVISSSHLKPVLRHRLSLLHPGIHGTQELSVLLWRHSRYQDCGIWNRLTTGFRLGAGHGC